jgi:hypothetical protein
LPTIKCGRTANDAPGVAPLALPGKAQSYVSDAMVAPHELPGLGQAERYAATGERAH